VEKPKRAYSNLTHGITAVNVGYRAEISHRFCSFIALDAPSGGENQKLGPVESRTAMAVGLAETARHHWPQ
jgi:hypothetical protein